MPCVPSWDTVDCMRFRVQAAAITTPMCRHSKVTAHITMSGTPTLMVRAVIHTLTRRTGISPLITIHSIINMMTA